jgi:DNA invertase Pin-like site-specific DNA recombinase
MKIGYARVSTHDQDEKLQIDALEKHGCTKILVDKVSGTSTSRPELDRLIDLLREGDTVVVWRLDRLGRSLKHLIELIERFKSLGVQFISLNEAIDTTTPTGSLLFHVIGAVAEFERALISERTKAGLASARARGRKGGRRKVMSSDQVKKARAMLLDPFMTKVEVASHFQISRPTLDKYLAQI